jgi:hypothetical protein
VLEQVLPQYLDAFLFKERDASDRGFTFDNKANTMFPGGIRPEKMRYDRVMVKSVGQQLKVLSYEVSSACARASLTDLTAHWRFQVHKC